MCIVLDSQPKFRSGFMAHSSRDLYKIDRPYILAAYTATQYIVPQVDVGICIPYVYGTSGA